MAVKSTKIFWNRFIDIMFILIICISIYALISSLIPKEVEFDDVIRKRIYEDLFSTNSFCDDILFIKEIKLKKVYTVECDFHGATTVYKYTLQHGYVYRREHIKTINNHF